MLCKLWVLFSALMEWILSASACATTSMPAALSNPYLSSALMPALPTVLLAALGAEEPAKSGELDWHAPTGA